VNNKERQQYDDDDVPLKAGDVVLVGMWQKYKDQAAENVALARKILGAG